MTDPIAGERTLKAIGDLAAEAGLSHIHLLAWRDLDDPEAGGSEVHAHNVAAIWAQAGLRVTHRTSYAVNHPQVSVRSGYTVVRKAGRYLVFPRSAVSEVTGRLGPCDGLVEIWNGMPFLSPLWWRGPRTIWLHHVHGPMWGMTLPPRLAAAGNTLEARVAPPIYRRQPVVTLSESSKTELVDELGFDPDRVTVVHPGTDPFWTPGGRRAASPTLLAVGRLVPVKNFVRLVHVAAAARERVPGLRLVIVGEGYERNSILDAVREHHAEEWVTLNGRVTDEELRDLYRSAWAVASTSVREGWGMTITEAAACGTPCIATDIAGHRDAAVDGSSGILATTDQGLSDAIVGVMTDAALRTRLQGGALARAAELTWDATALGTFRVLAADALRRRRR